MSSAPSATRSAGTLSRSRRSSTVSYRPATREIARQRSRCATVRTSGPAITSRWSATRPTRTKRAPPDAAGCVADVDLGEVTVSGILRYPGDLSPEAVGSLTHRAVAEPSPTRGSRWSRASTGSAARSSSRRRLATSWARR